MPSTTARLTQADRHAANALIAALRAGQWREVAPYHTTEPPMFPAKRLPPRPLVLSVEGHGNYHERAYRSALLWLHGERQRYVCRRHLVNAREIDCGDCRVGWMLRTTGRPYRRIGDELQLHVQVGYEPGDHRVLQVLVRSMR